MAVKIVKAKPQAPRKFLVIGEPFAGKTTLAAKAPKPLFISTDGNAAKMGLDAVNVDTVKDIREAVEFAIKDKEYETIVIDTIEGIADIFSEELLKEFVSKGLRDKEGHPLKSLNDLPWGKGTSALNGKLLAFSEALAKLNKNVIVLSYSKRQVDEATGAIVLASELKNIRLFTRFIDVQVLASFDGEKHKAEVVSKRETVAGKVDLSHIKEFLNAIGWEMPKRSVKVGSTRKAGK